MTSAFQGKQSTAYTHQKDTSQEILHWSNFYKMKNISCFSIPISPKTTAAKIFYKSAETRLHEPSPNKNLPFSLHYNLLVFLFYCTSMTVSHIVHYMKIHFMYKKVQYHCISRFGIVWYEIIIFRAEGAGASSLNNSSICTYKRLKSTPYIRLCIVVRADNLTTCEKMI